MEGAEDRHRQQREQYRQHDRETEERQARLEKQRENETKLYNCTLTGMDNTLSLSVMNLMAAQVTKLV